MEELPISSTYKFSRFAARNSKIIQYYGLSDAIVASKSSIDYYTRVVTAQGGGSYSGAAVKQTQNFYRLFMVLGMGHRSGGPGPNSFGNQFGGNEHPKDNAAAGQALLALTQWVEHGRAPE